MRKILFRAKIAGTDSWVYGLPYAVYDNNEIDSIRCSEIRHIHYIKTDTLGQFTGLIDKNGKEIYEGDIVKFIDDETMPGYSPEISVEVFWWNEFSKFDLKNTHKELNFLTHDEFEVIGNIHDNP